MSSDNSGRGKSYPELAARRGQELTHRFELLKQSFSSSMHRTGLGNGAGEQPLAAPDPAGDGCYRSPQCTGATPLRSLPSATTVDQAPDLNRQLAERDELTGDVSCQVRTMIHGAT